MWKWEAEGTAKGVVVLVHNVFEEHRRYAWQIESWRRNGFHVYMGDLAGHGTKAFEDGVHRERFFEYDKTVGELLGLAARHKLPAVLVGHGLGACAAIHALSTERHQISACIFTSPWIELQKNIIKPAGRLTGSLKLADKRIVDHGLELRHLTRRKFEEGQPIHSKSTAAWQKELLVYMEQAATIQLPDVPVMLHLGGRDLLTNTLASRKWLMAQTLSELHYKKWPFCYHDLFQEPERDRIFQESLQFAEGVAEAESRRSE